jgi:hypothetical protein
MKDSVGFIALGQGGGNIGSLFEHAGHNVIHLNTCQEDMDTLEGAKHTCHIKDGEGCSRDRDKAKELLIADFETILEQVNEKMPEEICFVIYMSGGGTGGGAGPLLTDYLVQNTDKKIGVITSLPSSQELYRPFINSYDCMKELENINGLGAAFILDNNKDDKIEINKKFVDLFSAVLEIPTFKDIRGNIDKAEIKELLTTRGAAVIAKTIANSAPAASLIKLIGGDGIFAQIEPDRVIKYIGMSSVTEIDMDAVYKEVGTPLDAFTGTNPVNTTCILTGLSYPYAYIESMRKRIDGGEEIITRNIEATHTQRLDADVNFLNKRTAADESKKTSASSKEELFAKYRKNS